MSTPKILENITAQVWAAADGDIQKVHYIAEHATRGELERALDFRRAKQLAEALRFETDKKGRKRLLKELRQLENDNDSTDNDSGQMKAAAWAGAMPMATKRPQ